MACTSARLQVQANRANHVYFSFQNVTAIGKMTRIRQRSRRKYHLWHWSVFMVINGFHRTSWPRSREPHNVLVSVSSRTQNVSSRSLLKMSRTHPCRTYYFPKAAAA